MAYIANQYNYATPLASSSGLISPESVVSDVKYFTLSDNTLDGSCHPISGDVGLWGDVLSDSNGVLPTPFTVIVTEWLNVSTITVVGSIQNYPVDFTVEFYDNDVLLYTLTETGNTVYNYIKRLPVTIEVTHYVIRVTKISAPNSVARLYNLYRAYVVSRSDTAVVALSSTARDDIQFNFSDTTAIKFTEDRSHVLVNARVDDTLKVASTCTSEVHNIHTVMKQPFRRIYGKVYITYTDPILDNALTSSVSGEAYNSNHEQLLQNSPDTNDRFFTLYDNDLSGSYAVSSENDHVGWTSNVLSDEQGYFSEPPIITATFAERPITDFTVFFNDTHDCLVEDFTVKFYLNDTLVHTSKFTGNTLSEVNVVDEPLQGADAIVITITKVAKARYPATVLALSLQSTFLYVGYQDNSNLISIDLLEELTYEDDVEALGGASANEVTVVLDNLDKSFSITNKVSHVAPYMKRNRKIVPYLGAEVVPGEIEWHCLGTYWSHKWDAPYNSMTASVVAFDTLGLLSTTQYTHHHVLWNMSLGALIDYVLNDAKISLPFLKWRVDEELYTVIIPYAWFEKGSHTAALKRISEAYPMHIYCDRNGYICAMPQRLNRAFHHDIWSDSTNVVDKTYSSLYTVLPNVVSVTVVMPQEVRDDLVRDTLAFDIAYMPKYTLNFGKPYIADIEITMDKDPTVQYSYEVYSWGIEFSFVGHGSVRSITCAGTALDDSNTSTFTRRDENSVRLNGAVTRSISASFIQTYSLATYIANRLFELAEFDMYDAEVNYRGDIALSINDPIQLLDGIAPDTNYVIKRHQLTWDGALTGTANLNT